MPYQIKCDGHAILDLRDDDLIVANPTVSLENNTVGVGSFTIYKNHPNFGVMHHMKSIFEVRDDVGAIFRGRMTDDTVDFDHGKSVDLEGVGAFLNDSIVRPYKFPDDFLDDDRYIAAAGNGGNVVEFFLQWLIDNHNAQVEDFQRFKLGVVDVGDVNNYITRENSGYESTWANIESRLFKSSLGGFLCFRYEKDGNYIDYRADFTKTNKQEIVLGENMLDLSGQTSAQETYSAIIPLGKEIGDTSTRLTIKDLPDGNITDDVVKDGDMIYSIDAVARYGKICVVGDYSDITDAENLLDKAVDQLVSDGVMLTNTVEVKAVDLHLSDAEIESFRMYQNVSVRSATHGLSAVYRLSKLTIPLLDPGGTEIVAGKTQKTLLDMQGDLVDTALNLSVQQMGAVKAEMSALVTKVDGEIVKLHSDLNGVMDEINGATEDVRIIAGEVQNINDAVVGLTQQVSDQNGKISEITQLAGEVYVVVKNEDGTLSSIINPEEVSIKKLDAAGNVVSGFYYDTDAGEFKFFGAGEFRSVDGKSYIMIDNDEFVLRSKTTDAGSFMNIMRMGYTTDGTGADYPYIVIGSTDGSTSNFSGTALVKKFSNGLWVGNSAPKSMMGDFNGKAGAVGFFIDTEAGIPYVVNGAEMKNVYLGDAIAIFG